MSVKILIIDDQVSVRKRAKRILQAMILGGTAPEVFEAENGIEAIEQVQAHHPDIILIDVNLPGMDSVTTIERIQALNGYRIALMTTTAQVGEASGLADVYIKKGTGQTFRISVENAIAILVTGSSNSSSEFLNHINPLTIPIFNNR